MSTNRLDLAYENVATAFDRTWKRILRFPEAKVCKHHAVSVLIEEFGGLGAGLTPPASIVEAIVDANDAAALAWERPPARPRDHGEGGDHG